MTHLQLSIERLRRCQGSTCQSSSHVSLLSIRFESNQYKRRCIVASRLNRACRTIKSKKMYEKVDFLCWIVCEIGFIVLLHANSAFSHILVSTATYLKPFRLLSASKATQSLQGSGPLTPFFTYNPLQIDSVLHLFPDFLVCH